MGSLLIVLGGAGCFCLILACADGLLSLILRIPPIRRRFDLWLDSRPMNFTDDNDFDD